LACELNPSDQTVVLLPKILKLAGVKETK